MAAENVTTHTPRSRRLFFSLPISCSVKQSIEQWRHAKLPSDLGKAVAQENFHITLAFLGNCTQDQCQQLINGANTLHAESFSLQFDQLGRFGKPRITFLAPTHTPDKLTKLVDQLRLLASETGLGNFGKYKPHITLFRKSKALVAESIPCEFNCQFTSFDLFESISIPGGVKYESLAHWNLT